MQIEVSIRILEKPARTAKLWFLNRFFTQPKASFDMGITGLLPMLKSVIREGHISSFANRRLAVDTYAWLHRAAYSCAADLCEGRETKQWVMYVLYMVDMLLEYKIEVTLVFDGAELPAKLGTERERAANRALNLSKARELTKAGNSQAAYQFYTQAVDISPRMAAELIAILRVHRPSVRCIVAPYEADAQMAFLCAANLVDGVISEDSDTIPFGCTNVLYKMQKTGSCQVLKLSDVYSTAIPGFDMRSFTPAMTICMCIVAGCDYLGSAKGVGIRKAHEIVSRQKDLDRILRKMRLEGLLPLLFANSSMPAPASEPDAAVLKNLLLYDVEFYKAHFTFHHQTIFDSIRRCAAPLTPINQASVPACFGPLGLLDFAFAGPAQPDATLAIAIADGLVDPCTGEPFNLPLELERPPAMSLGAGVKKGVAASVTSGQRDLMHAHFSANKTLEGAGPASSQTSLRRPPKPPQPQPKPQNQDEGLLPQQAQTRAPLANRVPAASVGAVTSSFFAKSASHSGNAGPRPKLKGGDLLSRLKSLNQTKSDQFWADVGPLSQGGAKGSDAAPAAYAWDENQDQNQNEGGAVSSNADNFCSGYDSDLAPPVDRGANPFDLDAFAWVDTSPTRGLRVKDSAYLIVKAAANGHATTSAPATATAQGVLVLASPGASEDGEFMGGLWDAHERKVTGAKRQSPITAVSSTTVSTKKTARKPALFEVTTTTATTTTSSGIFDQFRFST